MKTPYTTKTGIQIGCMYHPQQRCEPSVDMENLQTVLLNPEHRPTIGLLLDAFLWTMSACLLALLVLGALFA
jgi:hypothetical protein